MGQRITLADIARSCGVVKSTVSRVLTGNPRVSPETRRRVLEAAERLGYRPDPALRVLAAHRWKREVHNPSATLAFVHLSKEGRAHFVDTYVPVVRARAEALGYRVDVFDLREYRTSKKLDAVLYARGIKGVLVAPIIVGDIPLELDWSRYAAVACGVGEYRLPIHSVDVDIFAVVRTAWRECRRLGYATIGGALFRQPGPDGNDALRHGAFLYEQSQLPPTVRRVPIFSGRMADRKEFLAWVRAERPEAVIALNDGYYWNLKDAGWRIPEDLGFCALGGSDQTPCSGILRHHVRIATTAVNWVDQLIRLNECGLPEVPDEIIIEPLFRPGETLRPVRA